MDIHQINKDNAYVQNIGNQINNYYIVGAGTVFVSCSECNEGKKYESVKDTLYYPPQYSDRIISVLEEEHSVLIQGGQGSGKSVLAFYIAEQMKKQGIIASAYYLNTPSEWNAIKQWIQSVRYQEKEVNREGVHLWIVDNLHRIAGAVEDFPDSSVWGRDYCICCTRDLNSILAENEYWLQPVLSRKQIFKRNIDKETFLKCYHALADNRIGRHESDYLYQYIGGNLAMLRYLTKSGNLPKSLVGWKNEQFINFDNIYTNYFGYGASDQITRDNLDDVLKMLFLSQIDFSIPFCLQCSVCQTVLKDLYFETLDKELEMEHATLAELLTACICNKFNLDDRCVFTECLHWTLSNLEDSRVKESERLRRINMFLGSLSCYQFVLNQNQTLHEILLSDECFSRFLENNKGIISLSVWKGIMEISEEDSGVNAVFHSFVKSLQLIESMKLNHDYDFQFFQDRLSQDELEEVETMLLSHVKTVTESVLDSENEVCLMHLLLSLSETSAIRFVEQLQSGDLVKILCGNQNGFFLFARYYSRLEDKMKNILGNKLSTDDYRNILMCGMSIKGFVYFLSATTDLLRQELCNMLEGHSELAEILVERTVTEGKSIGTLDLSLRALKKESAETLETFERAIGIEGYERLLESQGTIPIMASLIRYSSEGMQQELSSMLEKHPELVEILVEKTVTEGSSIGTLDLSLRELKRESAEALEAFERAMGVEGYERLLESQGTIPIMANLIRYSSEGMQQEISSMLEKRQELVETLVERTVTEGKSIGTLDLSLRELKKESAEALEIFERAMGVEGYERLLESQGTIPILALLMCRSSERMQQELSSMLEKRQELAEALVERTVTEGKSIGTLDLSLRELKKESAEALEIFERAMGVEGYERLLESQGTIPIMALLMRCSSERMQQELSSMLEKRQELVETLVERTVTEGKSIGTIDLSLRALKKESAETLESFERAIGVEGYKSLLESQGTIPIMARLMQYSSGKMRQELSNMLEKRQELVETLVERTVTEGKSIGTLSVSIKALGKENDTSLRILETLIGADGYHKMFSKCNANSITILRIMGCSSMSDSLVDKMYANIDIWHESKNHISEESCTILKDFDRELFYAKKMGRKKFWGFVKEMVSTEEWLAWMKQGAILEEVVFILSNLPLSIANNIANAWLENNDGMMEGLRSVRQQRDGISKYDSKIVNRMIMAINNYNHQFFVLVDKEYSALLETIEPL